MGILKNSLKLHKNGQIGNENCTTGTSIAEYPPKENYSPPILSNRENDFFAWEAVISLFNSFFGSLNQESLKCVNVIIVSKRSTIWTNNGKDNFTVFST